MKRLNLEINELSQFPGKLMKSYCVKQKKVTECVEPSGVIRYEKAKNGRGLMFLNVLAAECGITKTKFVKQAGN